MPKALIIGIADTLNHELSVRDSFLKYAKSGWDADILMGTQNASLSDNQYVVDTIEMSGFVFWEDIYKFVTWIEDYPDEYPIVIFSYYTIPEVFERFVWESDRLAFQPRVSTSWGNKKLNTIMVGVGDTQAESGSGYIEGFYRAEKITESRQLTPSYVVPSVAGICTSLIDAGLTTKQSMLAIREHFTGNWAKLSGYGKFSNSIPSSYTETVQPPNALGMYEATNFQYSLFYGQTPDSVRLYREGTLVYDGNGIKRIRGVGLTSYTGSQLQYVVTIDRKDLFDLETLEVKDYEFDLRCVIDGVESDKVDYATFDITITENTYELWTGNTNETEAEPEPEPDEEPIPEPEPDVEDDNEETSEVEPITDPTKPTATRTGNEITLTRNETTATVKVYRKLRENDEWELVGTTTEESFTDEINPTKNYIYAIRLSNSETESALSEPVYVAGEVEQIYVQGVV